MVPAEKELPNRRLIAEILVIYAGIIGLRSPHIITTGRFWAEEGSFFYVHAWKTAPLAAIFTSFGGYLNLIANVASVAARWLVPIEFAPYVTITIGLVFHLLPALIVLTARDAWLRPPLIRLAALGVLLFTPSSAEIWLQTLHCQFELALACALIVTFDTTAGTVAVVRLATLFLAPLCGPGTAVFLLPLALRLFGDRTKGRLLQFIALGTGVVIQLVFFYHTQAVRSFHLPFNVALAVAFCREPLEIFLGFSHVTQSLISTFHHQLEVNPARIVSADVASVLFFGTAFVVSLYVRPAFWLLLTNASFTGVAIYGSLGGAMEQLDMFLGERYVFVGQTLCGLMIVAFAAAAKGWLRWPAALITVWMLTIGIVYYRHPWIDYTGPSWRHEVSLWRTDHRHVIQIWPKDWTITLR